MSFLLSLSSRARLLPSHDSASPLDLFDALFPVFSFYFPFSFFVFSFFFFFVPFFSLF